MNFPSRVLCAFLATACIVNAQRSNDPDLDEFVPRVEDELVIYVPKNAVRIGFRALSGAGTVFSGQGSVSSNSEIGEATGIDDRTYHDGRVNKDARSRPDPDGVLEPIDPDGYTNNWGFSDEAQAEFADGFIAMHAYSATVTDTSARSNDVGSALGVEVSSEREMGSLFGTRIKWGLVGGVSMNQILSETKAAVAAEVSTTRDYYGLPIGATPSAPASYPIGAGDVLLQNEIKARESFTSTTDTDFVNRWKVRGGYLTFRAGPTLHIPFGSRLSLSVSAGGVLVYSGTSYEVEETFTPETGADIVETIIDSESAILPGFYVDANLQYYFTDTAGFYLGAVYQSSGHYDQEVASDDGLSNYKARVNLSSLQGFRAGVSFKF